MPRRRPGSPAAAGRAELARAAPLNGGGDRVILSLTSRAAVPFRSSACRLPLRRDHDALAILCACCVLSLSGALRPRQLLIRRLLIGAYPLRDWPAAALLKQSS